MRYSHHRPLCRRPAVVPHSWRLIVAASALAATLSADVPAQAAGAVDRLDYRIASWTGGDGITLGAVRDIAQDQAGYLWLASDAGLVRFDGLRFSTSDFADGVPLPAVPSRAVHVARDGSVWAGYAGGRGLYRIQAGAASGPFLGGQVTGAVNVIAEDHDDTLWLGHDEGLLRRIHDEWEAIPLPWPEPDHRVFDVEEDGNGTLWIATATGVYTRTASGTVSRRTDTDGIVRALSRDTAGRLWMTDRRGGVRLLDATPRASFSGSGISLLSDRHGDLWVATMAQGLWKVPAGIPPEGVVRSYQVTAEGGLLTDPLSGLLEDRDGNIWVGSIHGIRRLQPSKAQAIRTPGLLQGMALGPGGTAWLGTTAGLLTVTRDDDGTLGLPRLISSTAVRAVHRDAAGTVWVARGDGLYLVVNGRLVPHRDAAGHLTRVTSIASDRRGTLYACDELDGLWHIRDGRLSRVDAVRERPRLVHVDGSGRVWLALPDGTILLLEDDHVVARYGRREGLVPQPVFSLRDDRSGHLWIGGEAGLSRLFEDRFRTLIPGYTLPGRTITEIVEDNFGDLWLGLLNVGVVHVDREELARALQDPSYQVHYTVYNQPDGTAGVPDRATTSVARAADGALWFATTLGVTVIDPGRIRTDQGSVLRRLQIEGASADDRRLRAESGATLPPGTSRISIDYTTLNLSSFDDIQIRYRLDGFDSDWTDGTGRRQASYTNLRPGHYVFRVQAARTANDWRDGATAAWAFRVAPAVYQTWWFLSLCVTGLGCGLWGVWHLRTGRIRREMAAVFNERVRVSREIHDTLLQSLAGIAMQLEVTSNDVTLSSWTRIAMTKMRRQLEDHMREARESIWDLRSTTLAERDVVSDVRAMGQRLTRGRVAFALDVSGTPRRCGPSVEHQMIRIAREALLNAVRHANASRITIALGFSDRALRLSIADDGCGFDPDAATALRGHYGLVGMRERASEVGGHCTTTSSPGVGTTIVAEFPLPA